MLKPRSQFHKLNQECYALVLKELLAGPSPTKELVAVSGMSLITIQELMRTFHRHQVAHIFAWDPDARGADSIPVWKLGPGRDAKRRKKSKAEICRDYRARKKAREALAIPDLTGTVLAN